jgi:GT2 family glycosyltransferase
VASLLYRLASRILEGDAVPGCDVARALELKNWAQRNLLVVRPVAAGEEGENVAAGPRDYVGRGRTYCCDVVVCCDDSSTQTRRAIQSMLHQESAHTLLHLVDNGGGGRGVLEQFANHGDVHCHFNATPKSPLATLHDLLPSLRTEYVALQDPRTISRSYRVCYSVGLLEDYSGDILGAVLRTPQGDLRPAEPNQEYRRYLPSPTLVIRRATLADMGGMSNRPGDDDAELVYRAFREARTIVPASAVTVDAEGDLPTDPVGAAPAYAPRDGLLRHHARGFRQERVACDVVLPFFGQLAYVQEALDGLLAQENADVVIHLIDDGSPEDTDEFLRHWSTHPRVRTYRNRYNVGQFVSFNNVFPYLETNLIAVQDGDDVSLPQRLHQAGNLLQLTGAGIYGAAICSFEDHRRSENVAEADAPPPRIRRWNDIGYSCWPRPTVESFLYNPTMVVRREVFAALGGFADFGDSLRNRITVDTEFCLRAYHAGVRFALSREPVVLYRRHRNQVSHDPVTGSGTPSMGWSNAECSRRGQLYRTTRFDAFAFGALGKHQHVTQRVFARSVRG